MIHQITDTSNVTHDIHDYRLPNAAASGYLKSDYTWGGIEAGATTVDVTLLASGWSEDTQTVTVTGMTSTSIHIVGLSSSASSAQRDAAADAQIVESAQGTDTLTFTLDGDTPTVDIPITVMMFNGSPSESFQTKLESYDATLLASTWSNGTQTVTITGMTATTVGQVAIANTATAAQREAARDALLAPTAQGTNSLTITADGDVPTIDIPITVVM